MPNPGDRVYKISRISVDKDGERCKVELLTGTVPEAGETQFRSQMVQIDLTSDAPNSLAAANEAAYAAFKAAVATALVSENEPIGVVTGATLIP
jgi:hypothetical protein